MTFQIFTTSAHHKHWVFAFYGFGQQAGVFSKLAALCTEKAGFIVIDLPYETLKVQPLKTAFIEEIKTIIETNNIREITGISYSIGSRYNLILAELLPSFIKKIILIAPDGVKINRWNRLATSTIIGNQLFSYLMQHPTTYLKILGLFNKVKILPNHLFAFIKWHVRNKENCSKVYNTWMNMKNMTPDLKKINQHQQQYAIPVIAFFGRHDFVINKKIMSRLKKEIPAAEIKMLEKDHNLLDDNLFHDIATYL